MMFACSEVARGLIYFGQNAACVISRQAQDRYVLEKKVRYNPADVDFAPRTRL